MTKRNNRARLTIGVTLLPIAMAVAMPADDALARGDEWKKLDFPDADAACGDTTVHVTALVNKEYYRETILSDGTVDWQVNGSLRLRYFTDERSVTVNASGPGHLLMYPNGDVQVVAHGRNSFWFTAEQAESLGVPQISVSAGPFDVTWHPVEDTEEQTVEGHLGEIVQDVCAELTA